MSETNSGEELMGKRYGGKLDPTSKDEDSYYNFEDYADDLEYEARCIKRTKRNHKADIVDEYSTADVSKKRKKHGKGV